MPGLHSGIVRSQFRRLVGVAALIVLFSVRLVRRVRNSPVSHFRFRGCNEHAPGVCQLSSFLPRESRYNKSKMLCGLYHNLPKKLTVCVSSVLSNGPVQFTYEILCTDTDQAHWFVAHEGFYAHVCAFFGSKGTYIWTLGCQFLSTIHPVCVVRPYIHPLVVVHLSLWP